MSRLRPLALCLFRRDDGSILVAPGYDEVKRQRFYRPLGGEIEFGERAEGAARRGGREGVGAAGGGRRVPGGGAAGGHPPAPRAKRAPGTGPRARPRDVAVGVESRDDDPLPSPPHRL